MKVQYVAHISEDGRIQTVKEHCENVSDLASMFARSINLPELGRTCGMMHDIGKYSSEFQNHILEDGPKVDHASAGAQEIEKLDKGGVLKSIAEETIASHHSGLLDFGSRKFAASGDGTLSGRLVKILPDYSDYQKELQKPLLKKEQFQISNKEYQWLTVSFMTRMLFSCVVDADFLDTEAFMNPGNRKTIYDSIPDLYCRLLAWLDKKEWRTGIDGLAGARSEILNTCISRGKGQRGLYTLTVPTGGGKTVSSLAFALHHATENKMDRVIYVIPYCSIIDQTVSVFSDILGTNNVLGHYSEAEFDDSEENRNKLLATENWDSPIVVTTAVQFFESLYSCKTSKCRKLHNIANSVVIFDEAQTFPVSYIDACVDAISELVTNCSSSCVLCTATQPALEGRFSEFSPGSKAIEICPDAEEMRRVFKRVNFKDIGKKTDEELTDILRTKEQALCIVGTVKHAYNLYQMLRDSGVFCLTTNILPIDRGEQLKEIRNRLSEGRKCVLIATSLIEAGIDIDFPVVYRAYAGIDAMIQAGGRCNREGRRPLSESYTYLFQEESKYKLPDDLLRPEQIARGFLSEDITSQDVEHEYFSELYQSSDCDKNNIISALNKPDIQLKTASDRFRIIDNNDWTLYIPIDEESSDLIYRLRNAPETLSRKDYRVLGKYSLHLFSTRLTKIRNEIAILDEQNRLAELIDPDLYSKECGLGYEDESGKAIFV